MVRTTLATLLAVAAGAGCTADDPASSAATTGQALVDDGTSLYGTAGFLWQPPMVATAVTTGEWDGSYGARLTVDLAEVDCTNAGVVGAVVHTFDAVQTVNGTQRYKVEFTSIADAGLVDGQCYRVIPELDGAPLGYRDVIVSSGAAAPPTGYVKWSTGTGKKVIAFRLEELDPDGDGVLNHVDACDHDADLDALAVPGQIGAWAGDGDASGAVGGDGAWIGTEAYAAGEIDQGFALDGASYVTLPLGPVGSVSTLQLWVRADAIQAAGYGVVVLDGTSGTQIDWNAAGGFRYSAQNGAFQRNFGAASLTDFVHLVIVQGGFPSLKLYRNGVQVFAGSGGGGFQQLAIGTNRSKLRHFDGVIDDLRVWNRALTASEVQTIYERGAAGICQ